jgi:hypothetical protein
VILGALVCILVDLFGALAAAAVSGVAAVAGGTAAAFGGAWRPNREGVGLRVLTAVVAPLVAVSLFAGGSGFTAS